MLRETLAVLAAILVAFALDAWWDDQQEHRAAEVALAGLAAEVDRNINAVSGAIETNTVVLDHLARVVRADREALASATTTDLIEQYASFADFETVPPELGALGAILEGGLLPAIDNHELRAAISGLPMVWQEATEEADVIVENGWEVATRLIAVGRIEDAVSTDPNPEALRLLIDGAMASDEVRTLLATIHVFTTMYLDELDALHTYLINLSALITEALPEAG